VVKGESATTRSIAPTRAVPKVLTIQIDRAQLDFFTSRFYTN
jgi:hypothetical protein